MDDVLQRKQSRALPIHKRKMFTRSSDIIFEQDCCTNSFGECMSRLHGKILSCSYTNALALYIIFLAKVGRLLEHRATLDHPISASLSKSTADAYQGGNAATLGGGEIHRPQDTHPTCSRTSYKNQRNLRLKGKKIPSNFDLLKNPYACKLSVCES